MTVIYTFLVEFVVLAVFILPAVVLGKFAEYALANWLTTGDARIATSMLFVVVGLFAWKRFNASVRRPLLNWLPR